MDKTIFADYHTHTIFSHGTGSIEENILAAIEKGLSEIAIADHGPAHLAYGIREMDAYFAEIERMKKKYAGKIKVLAGIECNLLSLQGDIDLPEKYIDRVDFVLFGYHKFVKTKGVLSTLHLYFFGKRCKKKNTQAYIHALRRNKIDIVTHPGYGLSIDLTAVAQACAAYGAAFEINNKHCDYSLEELEACAKTGCQFVISSDAHAPEKVGVFDAARARAQTLPPERLLNAKK